MIITAKYSVSMGHRLMSYDGICSSPHGHNMVVTATVVVQDRFIDFKEVNAQLAEIVGPMDHAMILQDTDPLVAVMKSFLFRHVVLNVEPTTENIAQYIFNELVIHYTVASVNVQETEKYGACCSHPNKKVQRAD